MFEKFCLCDLNRMTIPAPMNRLALNIAWVNRWKNERLTIPIPKDVIISPN